MRSPLVERLESRTLFAGVTILATGRLGGLGGWMQTMSDDITARLGGPSQVPRYILTLTPTAPDGHLTPTISRVAGTGTPQTSSSGEIIVLIDYSVVSANTNYSLSYIASVVANFMINNPVDGIRLAELPIHEIGVSRGTGLLDELAKALGKSGIWVDQETYLDPDPISAMLDAAPTIYDNVAFVDNYWRNDGSASQVDDGQPVNGAYNLNVYWLDADSVGYSTPHLAPAGYYIGTIDQTATQSGEGPIYSDWYGNTPTMPARNQTGFIYTSLVGAARPLSGVWAASGGTGARTATGQQGVQWPDVTDLAVTTGNTVFSGQTIQMNYIHQDRDSAATVTYYLDTDRNPYNNNFSATLGSTNLAEADTIIAGSATLSTKGVAAGTYWVCAKISDAQGDIRYAYNAITAPLTVVNPTGPRASLAPPVLTAVGGSTYQFSVDYIDNVNIVASTLGNGNLIVTGPGGYIQAATLLTTGLTNGTALTATYSVTPPNSVWQTSDNGTYAIILQPNQVSDTSNQFFPTGSLGTFSVNVPSLSGSQAVAAAGYNLTTLGTSDWAHWGRGSTYGNFDDKSTGGSQISNVTTIGAGSNVGANAISTRTATWTDGAPTSSDTNETGYIWSNGALNTGFSFTVPADTTTRTLYVYAGGYGTGSTLTAHLSDGSVADYVATASGSGFYTNLYTITYSAASAGQTLTITLLKTQNITGTQGSVDLIAAALTVKDTVPPTPILSAPTLFTATSNAYTFKVTWSDNTAVSASTLGNGNLMVTGPGGYNQPATLVTSGLSNGSPLVAAYSVPAPVGGWQNASNGSYTVVLQPNQVADTNGNFTPAAPLGTFSVNIPLPGSGSLNGSQAVAAASYNLTNLGKTDWAHWGRGGTYGNFDDKSTGGSQISNVTTVGAGSNVGGFSTSARSVTWTDGAPTSSDSNEHGYIWSNGALNSGFSFTVPADTTTRTLYIYAGGYGTGSTLTAQLSDGSAANFVATASGSGFYTNLYTITYSASSANQTLTITLLKTQNITGTQGSVDLIAAALVAPDTAPPTANLSAPKLVTASSNPYTFTVTWSDNTAVNASTLGNGNLMVTGPGGYNQPATLVTSGLSNGSPLVAAYSVPAPVGGWQTTSDGTYSIGLLGNQVSDTLGNFAPSAPLGTFSVNIPLAGSGSLSGSQAVAAASYNLTNLGTADWAHWGRGGTYGNFDDKSTGGSQISNVTTVGAGSNVGGFSISARSATWTDGTPTASDTNEHGYIWSNGSLNTGFSFTVPADTTTRTLYVYAGGYGTGSTLTAHLSDGSVADYVATASGSGFYTNLYTITYKAASAGQTLTITLLKTQNITGTQGSVDLIASALIIGGP